MVRCAVCSSTDHLFPVVVDYRTGDYYHICLRCKQAVDASAAVVAVERYSPDHVAMPEAVTPPAPVIERPAAAAARMPDPEPIPSMGVSKIDLGAVNVIDVGDDDGGFDGRAL